jgi:hypothetical protein
MRWNHEHDPGLFSFGRCSRQWIYTKYPECSAESDTNADTDGSANYRTTTAGTDAVSIYDTDTDIGSECCSSHGTATRQPDSVSYREFLYRNRCIGPARAAAGGKPGDGTFTPGCQIRGGAPTVAAAVRSVSAVPVISVAAGGYSCSTSEAVYSGFSGGGIR